MSARRLWRRYSWAQVNVRRREIAATFGRQLVRLERDCLQPDDHDELSDVRGNAAG